MRAGAAALPRGPDAALLDDHAAAAGLAMMPLAGDASGRARSSRPGRASRPCGVVCLREGAESYAKALASDILR